MGQNLGTATIVMGSRIPAFKGEPLNFEDWKWESCIYVYVEHKGPQPASNAKGPNLIQWIYWSSLTGAFWKEQSLA